MSKNKKIKEKKTLIIIDVQYDFCNPEGSLYVNNAEKIIPAIIDYVEKNKKEINQIIFTRDWHNPKDKSFEKYGGKWPVHCVRKTNGAEIDKTLYDALIRKGITYKVIDKGTVIDHEEYGAFEKCHTFHHIHPNEKPSIKNCYFENYEGTSGTIIMNNNIVICGIAGDYCVKETINNLIKHWPFKVEILLSGVASIDNGTTIENIILEKNFNTI